MPCRGGPAKFDDGVPISRLCSAALFLFTPLYERLGSSQFSLHGLFIRLCSMKVCALPMFRLHASIRERLFHPLPPSSDCHPSSLRYLPTEVRWRVDFPCKVTSIQFPPSPFGSFSCSPPPFFAPISAILQDANVSTGPLPVFVVSLLDDHFC